MSPRRADGFVMVKNEKFFKCKNCGDPIIGAGADWEHVYEEVDCPNGATPVMETIEQPATFYPVTAREKFVIAYSNDDKAGMKDALAEMAGVNLNVRAEDIQNARGDS